MTGDLTSCTVTIKVLIWGYRLSVEVHKLVLTCCQAVTRWMHRSAAARDDGIAGEGSAGPPELLRIGGAGHPASLPPHSTSPHQLFLDTRLSARERGPPPAPEGTETLAAPPQDGGLPRFNPHRALII
ncbi:hypothetical protein ABZP36_010180 [Zizania latifolia]